MPAATIPNETWRAHSGRGLLAYASLFMLAFVVFAPTLTHQFVWDDLEQVRDNEIIRQWSSFGDFWHKDILELSRKGGQYHSNYYRPLFYVQYLLYYKAFGLNTVAWHAMAIVVHALASCTVLLFLRTLRLPLEVAWSAALLFVVHPAHGESVSWVAAAFNDPPAAACLLLGLTAHARSAISGRWRFMPLAGLGYAGALCLKESGLSMLLLVALVEWYVHAARLRGDGTKSLEWDRVAMRYAVYVALTFAYFVVRWLALGDPFGRYETARKLGDIAPTFPMLAAFYLKLLVWPFGMAPSYPLRYVEQWSDIAAWGSIVLVVVLGAALLWLTWRRPTLMLCCLWIPCCVWPVFNILSFIPYYLAHQRYLYLTSLSVCLAIAWLLFHGVARANVRRGVLAGVLLLWSASNVYYNFAWRTDHDLWTRICEVDPKNPAGFDWLGAQAMNKGEFAPAEKLFKDAIAADPDSPHSYRNLGVLYRRQRRLAEAETWLQKALGVFARRKHNVDLWDISHCRILLAAVKAESGRTDEALRDFLSVSETPPHPPEAFGNAAVLLWQAGQMQRVEQVLLRGLSLNPSNADLLSKIVDVYNNAGQEEKARPFAERLRRAGVSSRE